MKSELDIEDLKSKVRVRVKAWLEFENESILGSGWDNLLEHIAKNKEGSLIQASKECGYSYKYAWGILKKIESRTGKSPVETSKGGPGGGGFVKLNDWGNYLIKVYSELKVEITAIERKLAEIIKTA